MRAVIRAAEYSSSAASDRLRDADVVPSAMRLMAAAISGTRNSARCTSSYVTSYPAPVARMTSHTLLAS